MSQMEGFGLARCRLEGSDIPFDSLFPREGHRVQTKWMELCVADNQSRTSVHQMVDEWLDQRRDGLL